jgi:serine/threonine-protein kinase
VTNDRSPPQIPGTPTRNIVSDIPTRLAEALRDRYRLERELGHGGMGAVYLAEDIRHHRKVAVKVLRPDIAASLGTERFLREIEARRGCSTRRSCRKMTVAGGRLGVLYHALRRGRVVADRLARQGELPVRRPPDRVVAVETGAASDRQRPFATR